MSQPAEGALPEQQALIILRSEAPLPEFCTPFPLPPATSDVSLLRLSVLRILDGQKRLRAETLTHSEQIKQMTIQGWRMALLDLIQVQAGERRPDGTVGDPVDTGLQLRDDHKCSALEHGDEIVCVPADQGANQGKSRGERALAPRPGARSRLLCAARPADRDLPPTKV